MAEKGPTTPGDRADKNGDKGERAEKAERENGARAERAERTNGRADRASMTPGPPSVAPANANGTAAAPAAAALDRQVDDAAPSIPPLPAAGPWRSYKELVAQIAQRILD